MARLRRDPFPVAASTVAVAVSFAAAVAAGGKLFAAAQTRVASFQAAAAL